VAATHTDDHRGQTTKCQREAASLGDRSRGRRGAGGHFAEVGTPNVEISRQDIAVPVSIRARVWCYVCLAQGFAPQDIVGGVDCIVPVIVARQTSAAHEIDLGNGIEQVAAVGREEA